MYYTTVSILPSLLALGGSIGFLQSPPPSLRHRPQNNGRGGGELVGRGCAHVSQVKPGVAVCLRTSRGGRRTEKCKPLFLFLGSRAIGKTTTEKTLHSVVLQNTLCRSFTRALCSQKRFLSTQPAFSRNRIFEITF